MRAVGLVLAQLALAVVSADMADATRCARCGFAGTCETEQGLVECVPSQSGSGCVLNGGILLFNSLPPNIPAYWTLFARSRGTRTLGRLDGRLEVWADRRDGLPSVPGFPGRCDADFCFGRRGRFSGAVVGDRFTGTARYADGATCDYDGTIAFGTGPPGESNAFTCRTASGEVTSQGALQVQGIRLRGCKP